MNAQEEKTRTNRELDTVVDAVKILKTIIDRAELYVDDDQPGEVVSFMESAAPLADLLAIAIVKTADAADDWQAAESAEAERQALERMEQLRKEQAMPGWAQEAYVFKDMEDEE